ncbi:MAG: ABC transporter ATP-binding protein [Treponema sp.]|nr:ABC transporter ATP-binding protein [Treponema sp.]
MNLLEARNLCFSYGARVIFKDVSFSLERGELLALLGPNGSGKTTLFRCLLGLTNSYKGDVFLEGENIRNKKPLVLARLAAYVPQVHHPSFNYTVMDMVLMGASSGIREWALPGRRQKAAAEEALAKINFLEFSSRNFRELSGGEQQMVLIARALAQQARILVMDEPTANLDYGNQLRLLMTISGLSRQGYSILISTHNPNHAFLFAQRVLALHNHELIAAGSPDEVLTPELIKTLYGVKVRLQKDEQGIFSSVPLSSL